jgi:hypothetical protein
VSAALSVTRLVNGLTAREGGKGASKGGRPAWAGVTRYTQFELFPGACGR